MIRLVYVLRRLPNLSRNEFQQYMSEKHGPLVARYGSVLRVDRYVQSYMVEDPFNDFMQQVRGTMDPYDGVDEFWWENREDLAKALATPEGRQAAQEIVRGEREFVEFSRSSLWFAIDYPQINPLPENNIVAKERSPLLKLMGFLRSLPNLSIEEGQRYWQMNHSPYVRSHCEAMHCRRYMTAHMIEDTIANELRAARGKMDEPYMGQADGWFDRGELTWATQTPEVTKFMKLLVEDEKKFTDLSRSVVMVTKERVFINK